MYANVVDRIYRCDGVLIKYMDMVKLYDEDFRILDRYRGFLEIIKDIRPNFSEAVQFFNKTFKKDELKIFDDVDNYIVDSLRKYLIEFYIQEKPELDIKIEILNKFK